MATKIQLRRDTAANWATVNPTLAAGELGIEADTGKVKFGVGSAAWAALPYATMTVAEITSALALKQDAANAATDAEVAAAISGLQQAATAATDAELQAAVDTLNSALSGKADAAATSSALATKVNSSTYTAGLAGKADLVSGKVPVAQLPVGRSVAAGNLGAAYQLDAQSYQSVLLAGTLSANCALTFANLAAGSTVTIVVTQDATGGRSLTVNGAAVKVNSTPASVTVLRAYSPDGSTVYVDAPGVDPGIVGAVALRTTVQSVANNATPIVTFDTEVWDTHGFVNLGTSASRITIPPGLDGLYAISAEWAFANNATGKRAGWIFRNGTLSMIAGDSRPAITGDATVQSLYHEEPLAAGDYLELVVGQNSGGALNLNVDGLGTGRPRLAVRRLGPDPR